MSFGRTMLYVWGGFVLGALPYTIYQVWRYAGGGLNAPQVQQ